MKRAVFLDRDGTINEDRHYLYRPEEFVFLQGVVEALRLLMARDYRLIIVTNQSGIARGYYTEDDYRGLNEWMLHRLWESGVIVDGTYYCPHLPGGTVQAYNRECSCRKPATGLFYQAAKEHDIELAASVAVGDRMRDLMICRETGCRGYLIGGREPPDILEKVKRCEAGCIRWKPDLLAAAREIE